MFFVCFQVIKNCLGKFSWFSQEKMLHCLFYLCQKRQLHTYPLYLMLPWHHLTFQSCFGNMETHDKSVFLSIFLTKIGISLQLKISVIHTSFASIFKKSTLEKKPSKCLRKINRKWFYRMFYRIKFLYSIVYILEKRSTEILMKYWFFFFRYGMTLKTIAIQNYSFLLSSRKHLQYRGIQFVLLIFAKQNLTF